MDKLQQQNIVKEVQTSFLEYSMSVIVARAIPDLRDGLKPVHRRILWSMFDSGYTPDKPHRKSARVVGDVMGKYHPHGDSSIYEAMVRMAQDFSYRYMLIDGHGNFGNMDGDGAAAMRYTEARMSKISLELLKDINKDTVDFMPNFDETEKEPVVLPSRFPNILVNGTMGIAVGMATNIPPHNLSEVIDGCVAYIENNDIDVLGLMQYIQGPDFPTGAIILGRDGIKKAYTTGRGSVTIRCKSEIDEKSNRIIITEIPYGVNTAELKQRIAELVRDKVIDGISDYHEETNLENGIRIVVSCKKEANPSVVLNNLYKHTALQSNFGIINLMLDKGTPKTLPLKDIIVKYVDFQKEVVTRRSKFELKKAKDRLHILEGLHIALDHIDAIIKVIRESYDDTQTKQNLMNQFGLSEIQVDAILEMKLRRLQGLEREKIQNEIDELNKTIAYLNDLLQSEEKILDVVKAELIEVKNKYGDKRRTEINLDSTNVEDEDLIPVEDIVVSMTVNGYIKRINADTYRVQNRGGKGLKGMTVNEDDIIDQVISMSTHDNLLIFTNEGKVYRIRGFNVPNAGRTAKGIPVINLLNFDKDEKVKALVPYPKEKDGSVKYLFFATKNGIVKRVPISEFESIRQSGKIAITLKDNDELAFVKGTTGNDEIIVAGSNGKAVRFNESDIREMGRTAMGVKGFNVDGSKVIGMATNNEGKLILTITEKGYGKKSELDDYRLTKRGAKGVKTVTITEKNGPLVCMRAVNGDEDCMIMTDDGIVIRISLAQVSTYGRSAQGVRVINVSDETKVSTVAILAHSDEVEDETETEGEQSTESESVE